MLLRRKPFVADWAVCCCIFHVVSKVFVLGKGAGPLVVLRGVSFDVEYSRTTICAAVPGDSCQDLVPGAEVPNETVCICQHTFTGTIAYAGGFGGRLGDL